MLLPLKAVISTKVRKDGKSVIYYQYCFSSTHRVLLNTDIAIPKVCWNAKRQCVSKGLPAEMGDFEGLNAELGRIRKAIETIIEHGLGIGERNIGVYVKALYKPDFKVDTLRSWNYSIANWKIGEKVEVVNGSNGKYLRTNPDNKVTDNLQHLIDFDWIAP